MSINQMQFKYVICLDVEATCWTEKNLQAAEIIEIGAVLLNLECGMIESEFHEYVRPTRNPILSDYCINLTGITQQFINKHATFPFAYEKFLNWLKEIRVSKALSFTDPYGRCTFFGLNTTFCSWTNWDLSHYFQLDCLRHGLAWPNYLRAWIDAKKMFLRKYPGKFTFASALQHIDIDQVGSAHSAIDDAKTLTKIVLHLYQNGVTFSQVTDWRK